jgi:regulator of sigma E protease
MIRLRDYFRSHPLSRILSPLIVGLLLTQAITDPAALLGLLENLVLISLVLTTAVGIHEFCHLLAARALGIGVDEYGLAFGPTIVSRQAFGIRWCINALPVGGYVKLHGEGEDVGGNSFVAAPAWKKVLVYVVGPISNLILALILLLIAGMVLLGTTDAANIVADRSNSNLLWWFQTDWQFATSVIANIYASTVNAIAGFLPHATSSPLDMPLAGIPSMATVSSKMLAQGLAMFVIFAALINLSLGVMNLLPIPPLDGGQAAVAVLQGILGRYYPARLIGAVTIATLLLLIGFMVYVNGIDFFRNLIGYMPSVAQ